MCRSCPPEAKLVFHLGSLKCVNMRCIDAYSWDHELEACTQRRNNWTGAIWLQCPVGFQSEY